MIQLVRNHETAFADEGGERSAVGSEAHREDHCGLLPNKSGNEFFDFNVEVCGPSVITRAGKTNPMLLDGVLYGISTWSVRLSKPKVVVRAHIQRLGRRASKFEGCVEIIRFSINQGDVPARNTRDRPCKTVIDAGLHSPDVEIVEVAVQSGIPISWLQMAIMLFPEALSEVISDMAEYD